MAKLILACLVRALLLVPADGHQSASREGSSVRIEGLTPQNWPHLFDPASQPPRMWLPPRARNVRNTQDALSFAQEAAQAIGRQMGAQQMPHDFRQGLGDGTMGSFQAKIREHFRDVSKFVSGIEGVVDYGLGHIGAKFTGNPEDAFNAFTMTAQRLGATSLANQFAPLLRSTTPPNPTLMFNMVGNAMASLNMPKETVDFYREMAGIRIDGTAASKQLVQALQNRTLRLLRNRTMPTPVVQDDNPDVYKKTQNMMSIYYQLPCAVGSKVCFSLGQLILMYKKGPGWWHTGFYPDGEQGLAIALGVNTATPWSKINTPFYIYPGQSVGHEYDIKFSPAPYDVAANSKTTVGIYIKMQETPTCLGTGYATKSSPRVDTCPWVSLVATGGIPMVQVSGELEPTRQERGDALVSMYSFFMYGGEIGAFEWTTMPDWAFVGFYRR